MKLNFHLFTPGGLELFETLNNEKEGRRTGVTPRKKRMEKNELKKEKKRNYVVYEAILGSTSLHMKKEAEWERETELVVVK
jgi:hypothetical protein